MKKIISMFLSFVFVLSSVFTPAFSKTGDNSTIRNSLGRCYKFTFGEDGDKYDYNSVLNSEVEYKNNTYYPFWNYTDKSGETSSVAYKTITDSSGNNGVDVLQLSTNTSVYLTPLTSDGKPFEVEPGKDYVVRVDAYIETDTDWSQMSVNLSGTNTRVDSWFESYSNSSRTVTGYGSYGGATLEKVKFYDINSSYVSDINRSISAVGFTSNNGANELTGHKGTTTDTATHINKTRYISVPSNEKYGDNNFAVYDQANDKLIEFVGDSITCGWGIQDSCSTSFIADGTQTYAYLASRELGIDYRIRSLSGSGFEYASNGLDGIPYAWNDMYRFQNPFRSSTTAYAPDRSADVVCIYLGTNDSSGWKSVKARGVDITEDVDYAVSKMKEFIATVEQFNPGAKIVWVIGGMTDKYGECAIRAISELGGETSGYYTVNFPESVSGDQGHPDRTEQFVMSNILKEFLLEKDLV